MSAFGKVGGAWLSGETRRRSTSNAEPFARTLDAARYSLKVSVPGRSLDELISRLRRS
jgi:hypothetical protein